MTSKSELRKLATFETKMVIPLVFDELWVLIQQLESYAKENNAPEYSDFFETKRVKTKPLNERDCAFLLKEIIKADLENKDAHIEVMLNPEISEARKHIKKNWSKIPDTIEQYARFNKAVSLPNLDVEAEITVKKLAPAKVKDIIFKYAELNLV